MELRVVAALLAFLTAATFPVIWASNENYEKSFNRSGFPLGFIFGTATSAYQVEGASKEGGRGPSIWDTFIHSHPDRIADRSNGDVADDSYHLFKEDVRLMKDIGMDAYRFSMSWPRILPNGSLSGGINKEGIQYYSNLINELLSHGLQPFVTLFHWDVPQTLEDQYGGFLSSNIVDVFHAYADICFKEFGDRVKHWITLNEPWTFASTGYAMGETAPGRCSPFENLKCSDGDSSREPYIAAHNMLLAHSAAVKLYREKYQGLQKGKIGITIVSHWFVPYSSSKSDNEAAARALDFMFGWFMDPLTEGDYPFNMRALVGNRLPQFTAEQSEMIKGSFDFLGLNYYTANYAENIPLLHKVHVSWTTDPHVNETGERNGKLIGRRTGMDTFYVYPSGIEKLLLYTKAKYNNPIIYITENGIGELDIRPISLERALEDDERIDFHHQHLLFIQKAIRQGVKVKGYFAWSLLDNFEWNQGYTIRFGINYVDHKNGQKRYQKKSAHWFHEFLKA